LKPYALVGGGAVRFSPNDNFNTFGVPQSDTKAAFAYGFGCDVPIALDNHLGIRLQYRGLVRSEPDFKLAGEFGTRLKTHIPEPSLQVFYHF
jgi:opacity protein-like surface antigen